MKATKIIALLTLNSLVPFSAHANRHTNFIVILLDDMGYGDLGSTGAIGYGTPNLDKMANDGIRFTRFYSAQAVSGASRAGLLTGCYPNRIGMYGAPDHLSKRGISEKEETIADILKAKEYACAAYGKWHLGFQKQFLPTHHGFDEFYGIPYSNDMWPNHPTGEYPPLPLIEGDETISYVTDQSQFTTDFTNRTLTFIEKNKNHPFFIYLAHPMPHVPLAVSNKFKGHSKQGLYGDVMMEIDWSIGEILKKLKKEGLDNNTLVIFTSDNGPWLNYGNHAGSTGGLREGKGVSFEGGQRVPCIMYWPSEIEKGIICSNLVSAIDILPTIATISGSKKPRQKIDGVDISSLFKKKNKAVPRKNVVYYYRQNDLEAVTDGEFKLVFPHKYRSYEGLVPGNDGNPGQINEYKELKDTLLFNLRRDPGERYNLMGSEPQRVKALLKVTENYKTELGDDLSGKRGREIRPCGFAQ